MDWIMWLGIILIALGGLALVGFKILPIKKNMNWALLVIGILIVSGIATSLFSGIQGLAISSPSDNTAGSGAYTYSVQATKGNSAYLLDENAKVILVPETYNSTAGTVNYATVTNNFTIGITDAYADMRGVNVDCTTSTFFNQNVSVSDSTAYLIVNKATDGNADIRIYDSALAGYQRSSRTFLLGGESTSGQSVTFQISSVIDATAVSKLNQYNSKDITCNIAGEPWAIRIQHTA